MPSLSEEKMKGDPIESSLAGDPRWHLIDRIVRSSTMRRASQLREMLLFVSKVGLTNPDCTLREHEIACKVLGRNDSFDPAYDNIVRVQAGHLRRKLEDYFNSEGSGETVRVSIPKGSYLPIFTTVALSELKEPLASSDPSAIVEELPSVIATHYREEASATERGKNVSRRALARWILVAALLLVTGTAIIVYSRMVSPRRDQSLAARMLSFFGQHGGTVTVILPDTSLLLVQKLLETEIPLDAYTKSSYPEDLAARADSPELQRALELLGRVRTTTLNEAEAGMDYQQMLAKGGFDSRLRYARDLRVSDLGVGNYILIGNQRSNPWVSLFSKDQNFQFTANPRQHNYLFRNRNPEKGEPSEYFPIDTPRESTNYVDVMLTPNLTDSGYVLLIIGSDVPGNEAAVRFLLRGEIPQQLEDQLRQPHLKSFEILLRGHHLHGESNDTIEIIAYRAYQR